MAAAVCSNGNGTHAKTESKIRLEAMQTVIPMKPTDPRSSIPVFTSAAGSGSAGVYKRCFNIVLCYNKNSGDEYSGSLVAGWIKESLGRALSEQPTLAGRLRKKDGGAGDNGELEIVSNDSGVRLIEAQFAMSLDEFIDLKEKNEVESQLVFWKDIDHEHNPQFSPLFYIQVSNFKCGGYAVGISTSLLLIDPFSMTSFLKKWTEIHIEMISKTDVQIPIFYRPNIGNSNNSSPGLPINSNSGAAAQTVIFHITSKILNLDKEIHKNIAALCLDESEQKLGLKIAEEISMVSKEDGIKVQKFSRKDLVQKQNMIVNGMTCSSNWDDLGVDKICFNQGNKAVYVSCWINSVVDDEAFVMIFPYVENGSEGMKIIVTHPI